MKNVLTIILYPFKFLYALIDPVLRYIEMGISFILNLIIGGFVELISFIPDIFFISTGEAILAIAFGVCCGIWFDCIFIAFSGWMLFYKILFCIAITVVSYFLLYFVFEFLLDIITSAVSLVIVIIRLAIYLPSSVWMTLIKILSMILCFAVELIFFGTKLFFDWKLLIISLAVLVGVGLVMSIIMLLIRQDVKVHSLGTLGEVELSDLKAFNSSIGIYIMLMAGVPVYIGRAIEYKNGGFRKRIRDYLRDSSSARKHTSGRLINANKNNLDLYIIELGRGEEDVEWVKEVESSMISEIFTAFNKVDSALHYVINVLGYILAGAFFALVCNVFIENYVAKWVLTAFAIFNSILCIVFYFIENAKK